MKKYSIIIFLFCSYSVFSQNQNSTWIFGDSAGIDFSNINNPLPLFSSMDGRGSCASISDSSGNLVFYCYNKTGINDYSTFVYNYMNDTIQNGNDLNGQGAFNQVTIIPIPNQTNNYYIFYNGIFSTQGFYYSLVDMNLNAGLGSVVLKNIPLIVNTRMADCVRAISHGNGRDWWIVAKLSSTNLTQINRFFVFLISPSGIANPIIQDFGNATDGDFQRFCFNNQGNKIMLVNTLGLMTEYDFDRCTGIISNPNMIYPEQTSNLSRFLWEGSYSPNDSIIYVTTTWYSFPNDTSRLLQYNLYASNIPASCDTLFEIKHPVQPAAVRLAPDSKIYISSYYDWGFPGYPYPDSVYNQYNMNLGVINSPDNLGAACNFQPFSFYLGGKRTYSGLPNNPNYELGSWVGSPCDTLGVGMHELEVKSGATLFVFYSIDWQKLFVNAQNIKGKNCVLQVFDINGREIFSSSKKTEPPYFTQDVNCLSYAKGMYIVSLRTEKEMLVKKFVKD